MAGTEYTYTIRFSGDQALADATTFKQQLEQRLGTLSFKTRLDLGSLETTLRGASERAARASGTVTQRAMQQTIDSFSRYAERTGASTFAKQMEGTLAQALAAPSKEGMTAINSLEESMRVAQRSTQKLGFTLDEYLGASSWEKRFAAIQAAQRRLWGVRGLGYQIAGYGRALMAGGGAALGAGLAAMKQYVDYAEPMNRAARNLDLNARLTRELDDSLRQLSGTVSYMTPKVQAEALYLWAAATGEVIDSTQELDQVLERNLSIQKLMILGAVDQETAVEAVTDVISQYGMNVSETERIVDTFITVAANSKAEVGDLAMAFSYAGTRAAAANTGFEETAAVMELLAAAGLRGSRAGRGVSRLIENLIAPSNVARDAMEELFMDVFGQGTEILINAEGQFVGLAEAIKITADATEEMTEAERANYVAVTTTENAARALTPLLEMEIKARQRGISILDEFIAKQKGVQSDHREAAQQMMQDIYGYTLNTKSATETAAGYWEQYTNSITGRMDKLKAAWSSTVSSIGAALAPGFASDLEKAAGFMEKIARAIQETPQLADKAKVASYAAIIIGALGMVAGKALTITADIKAILMAKTMQQAADKHVYAAQMELRAAMMKAGQSTTGLPPLVAPGAGGGGRLGRVGSALGRVAMTGLAAYTGGEIASQVLIGRSLGDMFNFSYERQAGEFTARESAATMSLEAMAQEAGRVQKEMATLKGYTEKANLFFGKLTGGEGWAEIPEEYKGIFGLPSGTRIKERYTQLEAELKIYEEIMVKVQRAQERDLARREGAWGLRNLRPDPVGLVESTTSAQASLNARLVAGRNLVADLGAAFGMSEDDVADWIDTLFQGDEALGLTMDDLGIAIQMMNAFNTEVGSFDIALAGGEAAAKGWGDLLSKTGDFQGFGEAAGMYQDYLDGLYDMLSKSQAATGAELQWEIDEYNRSWQERIDAARDYSQQYNALLEAPRETSDSWVMQFAGVMDYSAAIEAAGQFEREQASIIRRYQEEAEKAGKPIDFTALEFALAANAAEWAKWADVTTTAIGRVESLKASALESGWSAWEGLAGIMGERGGPTEAQILAGFGNFEQRLDALINDPKFLALDERTQSLRIAQFLEANRVETDSYSDAVSERKRLDKEWLDNRKDLMKQAEQGFRNLVSQGFQPTDVTQEDVLATKAGNYKDKWDEYARQVRAAMAGSQEWDWMIPDPVKQGGAQAINEWGQNILDQFYAGMMPDQVNWDAFVSQFQKNLAMAAGKERLVDRAIEELASRGITATSEDVLSALGLQSPFQQYFFGGLSTAEASESLKTQTTAIIGGLSFTTDDVETPATSWSTSLVTAMDAQLSSADLLTPISNAWRTQITEKGAGLTTVGEALGAKIWEGVKGFMSHASFVDSIVQAVLDTIGAEMGVGRRDKAGGG